MSTAPAAEWLDRRFSPREKVELGLEIVAAYGRARWWLWRTDLPRTLAALRPATLADGAASPETEHVGARLGWVVGKTLRRLPFDSRCLMRSLVLTSLLARRGIASSLVIAVQSEPEFGAHAWVESRGVPLLPPADSPFSRIVEI